MELEDNLMGMPSPLMIVMPRTPLCACIFFSASSTKVTSTMALSSLRFLLAWRAAGPAGSLSNSAVINVHVSSASSHVAMSATSGTEQ